MSEIIRRDYRYKETLATTQQSKKAATIIMHYRGLILDGLEVYYADDPAWPRVRNLVLRCLGQSGLEGKILEITEGL